MAPPRKRQYKYPEPTPDLLAELRLAYVGNVREVAANLRRMASKYGRSVGSLKYHAHRRGWRCRAENKPWTPDELGYLAEKIGTVSIAHIAHRLKRSRSAVITKAERLKFSIRIREGYNISDLVEVFGVHHCRVESWAKRGLLGKAHGHGGYGGNIRFTEGNIVKFIREHPQEYSLSRVDQMWFKAMFFGHLAEYAADV